MNSPNVRKDERTLWNQVTFQADRFSNAVGEGHWHDSAESSDLLKH